MADACTGYFNCDTVKEHGPYLLEGLIKYYLSYKESGVLFVYKLQKQAII